MPFVFCISFGFFIIHIFADFKYGFSSELYSMEKKLILSYSHSLYQKYEFLCV